MSSKHHITTIHDPNGAETEVRIHFVLHPYVPMRGPSYASGGEPEEPASIEFDSVQMFALGQWADAPKLAEWAEEYLHGDGEVDAFETAHDDHIAGEEYAAEARAEARAEAQQMNRSTICQTCDGTGEIGGFVGSIGSGAEGYQTDPCPDCQLSDKGNAL